MINPADLRYLVIRPTLQALDLWNISAEALLLGTAMVESVVGTSTMLKQMLGPALGIYQIEPATHQDVWDNFLAYRKPLALQVASLASAAAVSNSGRVNDSQLITNLAYATVIARLVYYRRPEPLPRADNIEALGQYWKQHYNTSRGAGSVDKFVKAFPA